MSTVVNGALQLGIHDPIPAHLMRFEEDRRRYLKLSTWTTQSLGQLFLSMFDQLQLVRILPYLLTLYLLLVPVACHSVLITCYLLSVVTWRT